MMRARPLWIAKLTIWLLGILTLVALAATALMAPALAAAACPACYGLERVERGLYADKDMTDEQRRALSALVVAAKMQVTAFYSPLLLEPTFLACASDMCDRRLGGRGARAVTYSSWTFAVIRLSPRGLNTTIVAHELSHVHVHQMVGVLKQIRGGLPAWFDEGLAVLVSEDARYLKDGRSASERCLTSNSPELPSSPHEWGPLAGRTPMIYADAACRVMRWMDVNGGKAGLLTALDEFARGKRQLP